MSNLIEHAKRELDLAGLNHQDSDYDGMLYKAVMELVEVFNKQGHSGHSASITAHLFGKIIRYENLNPLTNSPDEWTEVGEGMWQNSRNSKAFSHNGGETYYFVDEDKGTVYESDKI